MEGWIKTYRALLEWEWHDVPAMMTLWMHLLLLANNKDREWHGSKIRRGQFATSIASLSSMTGLSVKQIRTCIQRLKDSQQIVTERASKFTIITICEFDTYQSCEQAEGQTNGNERAGKGQAKGTERASKGQQRENIRKKEVKNNYNTPSNEGESVETDPSVDVDLKSVVEFFNKSVVECGSVLPKIKGATGKRVGYIKARIREFGLEAVYEVISKAAASDFLNGKNQRGWVASFDWIMLPTNFPKVLEGNYDNRNYQIQPLNGTNKFTDQRRAERERLARGYAAVIARLAAEDDARAAEVRQSK